ncbi:MAG TPA: hypothetical protein VJL60_04905, partial [Gammaproteobacteria bacterium]|nr:hypothetical protein [Gammaproteobacteria bacterium]
MPENKNQKQWLDELSAWSYWDPTDLSQWMYKQLFSPENQGQSIPILLSIAKNADRTVSESIQKKANKLLNHLYNLGTMPKSRFETDADYRQRRQAIQSDMLTRMETDNIFINERKKPPLNGWLDIFPGRLLSAAFGSVLMSVNGG